MYNDNYSAGFFSSYGNLVNSTDVIIYCLIMVDKLDLPQLWSLSRLTTL